MPPFAPLSDTINIWTWKRPRNEIHSHVLLLLYSAAILCERGQMPGCTTTVATMSKEGSRREEEKAGKKARNRNNKNTKKKKKKKQKGR